MSTTTSQAQAGPSKPKSQWTTSTTLPSKQVRPDTSTPRSSLEGMIGREVDPSRMAIYLCLLDENPHLHPSLTALHKHRLAAHGIPLPSRPDIDHPISTTSPTITAKEEDRIPAIMVDGIAHESHMDVDHHGEKEKAEWLMWRVTDEESLRRKAYLPLT